MPEMNDNGEIRVCVLGCKMPEWNAFLYIS
jgi:hypothetical protein